MPAETKAQRTMMCMALAMKRGDLKKTPGTPAAKASESMSEQDLVEMCGSKSKEETKK